MDNNIFQNFNNITFSELWPTKDLFVEEYENSGIPLTYKLENGTDQRYLTVDDLSTIWVLLTGRFADSTIKSYNTYGAFKIRFMSKLWQYGPSWKKELEIQNSLRSLSLDANSQLYEGSRAIYNKAFNPSTGPGTQDTDELNFINEQNVSKQKKSKIEGLAILSSLLKKDITDVFLRRFDEFFKTIIYSGRTLLYETELEGEN